MPAYKRHLYTAQFKVVRHAGKPCFQYGRRLYHAIPCEAFSVRETEELPVLVFEGRPLQWVHAEAHWYIGRDQTTEESGIWNWDSSRRSNHGPEEHRGDDILVEWFTPGTILMVVMTNPLKRGALKKYLVK